MFTVPEDFTEFLYWVKERTEAYWRRHPRFDLGNGHYEEWPAGIHWIGLSAAEIDAVEARYQVRFTPAHREFLRVLHTLDRPYTSFVPAVTYPNGYTEPAYWDEHRVGYNWLREEAEIRARLAIPYEDLRTKWLPVWGPQPESAEAQRAAFERRFAQAPKLLPITWHRYVVSEPGQADNLVLSVATDIIVYGWNLREYLLAEFGCYLDLPTEPYFDADDQEWCEQLVPEVSRIHEQARATSAGRRIPLYEDFIEAWNGWPRRAEGQRLGPILDA